jgi:hypothetical protein
VASDLSNLPPFAKTLQGLSDEDRKAVVSSQHPDYTENSVHWHVLLDAFEGRGGLVTGEYLWRFPREEDPGYNRRKEAARYHNYLETLVDIYIRFVWSQGVKRTSKDPKYDEWLTDVDGDGLSMDDFLKRQAGQALVGGHCAALVDKTTAEAVGPTRAEEASRVVLSTFPSTTITDWRFARSELTGVKLLEDALPESIAQAPDAAAVQYLIWDTQGWARFDTEGQLLAGDMPGIGLVPVVPLRPKPSNRSYMLGRPLISNANIIRAMFNRTSEEDQVLCDQAFSILTCDVHPDADVDQARAALAGSIGTTRALVAHGKIDYATPDMQVPQAIRDNVAFLIQEMYRAAHVKFRKDSLEAETAEAIKLQHAELNEALQGLAQQLESCERKIARCYYAWTEATPELAQAAFERADPKAVYPDEFFVDSLLAELQAWAEGIALGLGQTMTRRIKKRAARRIDPSMSPDDVRAVDAEIDAIKTEDDGTRLMPTLSPDLGPDTGAVQ